MALRRPKIISCHEGHMDMQESLVRGTQQGGQGIRNASEDSDGNCMRLEV